MDKTSYKALRPAYLNNTHVNEGDTITLHPRAAVFLIADGTLEEITTKPAKDKGAK